MSKKVYIPILIAVVAALAVGLWAANTAFAKDNNGLAGRFRQRLGELGQVTEIKNNEFSIEKRDGSSASFHVSDATLFRDREGNALTFADLTKGRWVVVRAPQKPGAGDKPEARMVTLLPEDFDPQKAAGAGGAVQAVNQAKNQFTVKNRAGTETTITVDSKTIYKGEATDLAGLKAGMLAMASGEKSSDGGLLAQVVRSSYPLSRGAGEVTAVNTSAGTFTVQTRFSGDVTFSVDGNTRFRSKDNTVAGLADLKDGMVVVVIGSQPTGAANPVARMVAAANKEDLPQPDKRFLGKVVSTDSNSLTIQTRFGQQITVQVTGETLFRSSRQAVSSLDDLKEGMIVMVGVKDLGNGKYQALVVIAGMRMAR